MAGTSAKAPVPTARPAANGREVLDLLRRPFTANAIKFKIQAGGGTESAKKQAVIVSYLDARLVIERLNDAAGLDWHDEYETFPNSIVCRLTVCGTTRIDVGEPGDSPQGKKPKAVYSDALKRAAVKFGVGVPIYAMPIQRLAGEHLTYDWKGEKKANGIAGSGLKLLRAGYEKWLELEGIKAFGDPIDHGDALEAVGDAEIERGQQYVDADGVIYDAPAEGREPVERAPAQALTPRDRNEQTGAAHTAAQGAPQQGMREVAAEAAAAAAATAPPDRLTPAQMAAQAFVEWLPRAQSEEAKQERNAIEASLAVLTDNLNEDGTVNRRALPGTWSGRGNLLYGLIGDAIQNRDECSAALAEALQKKQAAA